MEDFAIRCCQFEHLRFGLSRYSDYAPLREGWTRWLNGIAAPRKISSLNLAANEGARLGLNLMEQNAHRDTEGTGNPNQIPQRWIPACRLNPAQIRPVNPC